MTQYGIGELPRYMCVFYYLNVKQVDLGLQTHDLYTFDMTQGNT